MSHEDGLSRLEEAISHWCQQSKFAKLRNYYRQQDQDYGQDLWRIKPFDCQCGWYYPYYRHNDSKFGSNEVLSLKPKGMSLVREPVDGPYQVDGGSNHIYLMRMNEAFGSLNFSMSIGFTQRTSDPLTMLQEAMAQKKSSLGDDVTY